MITINDTNYELFLLQYAEGMLSDIERSEVEAWLADHPEAAEELALYSEAPRLERDPSVAYAAAPPQSSRPLWPALLRWSAAAAVLAALMLPAFRMGTMGKPEPQQPSLLAAAQSPQSTPKNTIATIDTIGTIVTINTIETIKTKATTETIPPEEPHLLAQQEDTLPMLPQEPQELPATIPSDKLIVYLPAPDTVYTNTLIAYDDSRPRFRDLALDWVVDTPVAQFIRRKF
ncbi:MAG: hypothetical protein J6X59_08270 [Bacteroidales bacterium]|nr:hypothetical protein [Bacteroidales bacterium]